LVFQYFDFKHTWWKLFQKRVVRTKFDICYIITNTRFLSINIAQYLPKTFWISPWLFSYIICSFVLIFTITFIQQCKYNIIGLINPCIHSINDANEVEKKLEIFSSILLLVFLGENEKKIILWRKTKVKIIHVAFFILVLLILFLIWLYFLLHLWNKNVDIKFSAHDSLLE
jgi:hypothetical protein